MSSSVITPHGSLSASLGASLRLVQQVAFWFSVVLALCYPVGFVLADTAWVTETTVLLFMAVHIVAIVIGHGYDPRTAE